MMRQPQPMVGKLAGQVVAAAMRVLVVLDLLMGVALIFLAILVLFPLRRRSTLPL